MLDVIRVVRSRFSEPTARALAHAVSAAIGDGTLPGGTRLPPIRVVAAELGLSPTTVSAAWSLLARSAAISTDGRRGTTVAPNPTPGPTRYRRALAASGARTSGSGVAPALDLSTGVPDPALLPDLGAALGRLRRAPTPQTYLDEPVVDELDALLRAGWPFPPEALTITDGAMDALDLLSGHLVRFGDRVAVEHPSFPPLLDLLEAAGAQLVPIDVDGEGADPEQLRQAVAAGVRTVFLQPRAQNPTGASLTSGRARELVEVLAGHDVAIIENDSAGAVASSELISLGRWLPAQCVYIRSFSKSHGPDLRLAAIGGAASLVRPIVERRHLGQGWTSRLLQRLLLDLLTRPDSIAVVDAARVEYARRRSRLTRELAAHGVDIPAGDGLNVWIPVADEATALVALASRGIGAAPGAPFAARPGQRPHLRVTAGLLGGDDAEIVAVAQALAGAAGAAWTAPR